MRKLIFTLTMFSTSLHALDQTKLLDYVHEKIDTSSYLITHPIESDNKLYTIGYLDAMQNLLYMIDTHQFD